MRSMISSSERALARSDFRRFWPLLFGYAVLWLCALPLSLWSRHDYLSSRRPMEAMASVSNYFYNASRASIYVSAFFAVLLAMALFAYLMNSRSVGLMHSLPITRGRQFATHFAVGVVMFTAVHLATALLTLPVQAALGAVNMRGTWEWFAAAELTSLFFFALATLCAMITGWLLAVPVIYTGINFLFAAFHLLFSTMTQLFYWGYESAGWPAWVNWLTPFVRLYQAATTTGAEDEIPYGVENGARYYFDYLPSAFWKTMLIYTAAAVLFIVLAWLFCRARRSETAGDAIVFPWLRPIVLYVISLAGGMGLGILLWYMVSNTQSIVALLLCQIVAGLIVYFGVQMLLHKSFKVFNRRGWLGAAALTAVLVILCLVIRFDAFGAQKYIPDVNQIESAEVRTYGDTPTVSGLQDPQGLEKLTAFHKAVLDQGKPAAAEIDQVIGVPTSENDDSQRYITFAFSYYMKDGSTVYRTYTQIVRRGTPLYEAANAFYNDPAVRQVSYDNRYSYVKIDPSTITGGWFNNYDLGGDSVELTAAQTRQLYAAIQRYYDANRQKTVDILHSDDGQQRATCFYLEFNYRDAEHAASVDGNSPVSVDTENGDCFWNLDDLPADCTEVLDLLVSFGLAETTDDLLYD